MPTITQEYEAARKANEERYAQAMQIYDEIISRYRPGGEFQKAQLGELEKRKTRETGQEMQQMISGGLYGTTTAAGIPRRWEAEVGAPSRLKLEDIMMQRLSQAQVGKAGFMERREDVYPDVGRYAGYAGATAAQPRTVTRTYGGTYGAGSFPDMFSITGEGGGAPTTPTTALAPTTAWGSGTREATMAEREKRAKAAATVGQEPPTGSVPYGARTAPTIKEPTLQDYLREHGLDPMSTELTAGKVATSKRLQQQWASQYR